MLTQEKLTKVLGDPKNQKDQPNRSHASEADADRGIASSPERLTEYLKMKGCPVIRTKKRGDGSVVLVLEHCPMNPEHGQRSDTAVVWRPDSIGFSCKHNGCQDHRWKDARQKIDPDYDPDGGSKSKSSSQATRLVEIAVSEAELFHDADHEAYVTIPVQGHTETWLVKSKSFRRWLSRRFHEATGRVSNAQAMQDALTTIAGKAEFEGTQQSVHVRSAEHGGAIYLDLADEAWRVVEITAKGWRVLSDAPVRFVRSKGMLALPDPQRGGKINSLRVFLNVRDDHGWFLIVAFIIGALNPRGPYLILVLNGEQGAAKSTTARVVARLVDPRHPALRSPPREELDLLVSAKRSHVLAFDNVRYLREWFSDALCRLATGAGSGTRELYTNDDEVIFDACRPTILTGIGDMTTQSDLLDRTVRVILPQIPERRRRTEKAFWAAFDRSQPKIFGAILDAVSCTLRHAGRQRPRNHPRMADVAEWVTLAEPALPWKRGGFLEAYNANRATAHELALEASPVAGVLRRWLLRTGVWTGTATDLLDELRGEARDAEKHQPRWPRTANRLANELRQVMPDLRDVGVAVEFDRSGHDRKRVISIRTSRKRTVRTVRRAKRKQGRGGPGAGTLRSSGVRRHP